jgi:N-acetylglucosamine-6-phosphate deacetylase
VKRESFEIAWRLRGRNRTILVSDAMSPAGSTQTHFVLQGREISVQGGRCVAEDGTLAGAAITLSDAVRIGIREYGMEASDALYCATRAPARLLGVQAERGCLQAGAHADLIVFDADFQVAAVMQSGRWINAGPAIAPLLELDDAV